MLSLFEMSLTGGIFIAAAVIVRFCSGRRLPPLMRSLLWAAALCRLLLPFRISFKGSIYAATPARVLNQNWRGLLLSQPQAAANESIPWLLIIWVIGAAGAAFYFLFFHFRGRARYRASLPVKLSFAADWLDSHRLRRPVQLRYSDRIASPLTYGILWPVMLLPKSMLELPQKELCYVLAHEMAHIRRFDALTKWLLAAALCVHWFNPLVWLMYLLANRDMELACDANVLKLFGAQSRTDYALTLVELESRLSSPFTPLESAFSKNAMRERIISVMHFSQASVFAIGLCIVFAAGTAMLFLTSPSKQADVFNESTDVFENTAVMQKDTAIETIAGYGSATADDSTEDIAPAYTNKQYENVINTLKFPQYKTMSIKEFNQKINAALYNSEDDKLLMDYEQLSSAIDDKDPNADFLRNTLWASITEYQARVSEVYSGQNEDPQFSGQALFKQDSLSAEELGIPYSSAYYRFSYSILNQDGLTVEERDSFLQSVMALAQEIWEQQQGNYKNFHSTLLEQGKALSNNKIEFTGCTVQDAETGKEIS